MKQVEMPFDHRDDANQDNDDDDDDDSIGCSEYQSDVEGSAHHHHKEPPTEEVIGKEETRGVVRLRIIVALVLVCSAIAVAVATYFYITKTEQSQFENQFIDDSAKVLDAIGSTMDKTLGLLDSLTVALVSHARETKEIWPFVTLPDFGLHAIKVLPITNALLMTFHPMVSSDKRSKWEAYSIAHDSWMNESMKLQEDWDGYYGTIGYGGEQTSVIFSDYGPIPVNERDDADQVEIAQSVADWIRVFLSPDENALEPISEIDYPIVDVVDKLTSNVAYNGTNRRRTVGVIAALFYWRDFIRNTLPQGSDGIQIVFENPCTLPFTYQIMGPQVQYLGVGDYHDSSYNSLGIHKRLSDLQESTLRSSTYTGVPLDDEYCPMTIHMYPSDVMKDRYTSTNSIVFTISAIFVFAFTSLVFYLYDATVERRQRTVMNTAVRSTAIVSSLFPSTVRDHIYPSQEELLPMKNKGIGKGNLQNTSDEPKEVKGGPIATLYPETTVLFADIAGFTAWSSVRQPTQVFHLLESIFAAFDATAKKRGIFKVETIGDCYVAVVGLPTPRKHHAVAMARFAADCIQRVNILLTQELDKVLGPGTAELAMRFGLNSGPTTAGVLRGEKTRFQLFGDTVNTAARMESNGERNKIHVSQKTAEQIKLAGKGHWLSEREEKVNYKGKGLMTTYWCNPNAGGVTSNVTSASTSNDSGDEEMESDIGNTQARIRRLVDWNVDMFEGLLKDIIRHRRTEMSPQAMEQRRVDATIPFGKPIDEVTEVLSLVKPHCVDANPSDPSDPNESVEIIPSVAIELRQFIESIADLYRCNPFHNFDLCSHVSMSTKKLLDRISENATTTTNTTTLDPLTRFAIMFSALIHDVDHPGVSNSQLLDEGDKLATGYSGKSVAEQNSVDVAWRLFQEPQFANLRDSIYTTQAELQHFRQVVVNVVMATDLFDRDLLACVPCVGINRSIMMKLFRWKGGMRQATAV